MSQGSVFIQRVLREQFGDAACLALLDADLDAALTQVAESSAITRDIISIADTPVHSCVSARVRKCSGADCLQKVCLMRHSMHVLKRFCSTLCRAHLQGV